MCNFVKSCAYIGHTDGFDTAKLLQMFRRIYKQPQEAPMDVLLDLFIMLALQNVDLSKDEKSKAFFDSTLAYIDEYYKGQKSVTEKVKGKDIILNYYDSI